MPKHTWIENSGEAIKTVNRLDAENRRCKLRLQQAILTFGKESEQALALYQELAKKVQYREGFKLACEIFSR